MALGNFAGRCKVDINRPTAQAECERCGCWWALDALSKQMQWQGSALIWTGNLVCPRCLDTPFEQNKVLILPADPKPRLNARQSPDVTFPYFSGQTPPTSPQNQGWTVWDLATAAPEAGTYPIDKSDVLYAAQELSNITIPGNINDHGTTFGQAGIPITLLAANPTRTWVALYNPSNQGCEINLGSTAAAWNGALNLQIGAGQLYFWAIAQNLTTPYAGAISAISQYPGAPIWAWDTTFSALGNDGGVLYVVFPPSGFPSSPDGLPPGALYLVQNILPSNESAVGIVPGVTPNPSAPKIYYAGLTEITLLATGGGNLPTTSPPFNSGILWNNGYLVCIA